jgi:hypothetical protein
MITLGRRDRAPATLSRIYICRRAGLTAREEASTETAGIGLPDIESPAGAWGQGQVGEAAAGAGMR